MAIQKIANTSPVFHSGFLLAITALVGTGIMAITFQHTKDDIVENQRQVLIRSLSSVLPDLKYSNNFIEDNITVTEPDWLGSKKPLTIYRARQYDRPVAAVITSVAPNGYNGPIKLIVGIDYQGVISGVRVVQHRETPGLGDGVEAERSDWILGFIGKSQSKLTATQWQVKKDGGVFDQLTGATITTRAIVESVHRTLQYYVVNRGTIYYRESDTRKGQ